MKIVNYQESPSHIFNSEAVKGVTGRVVIGKEDQAHNFCMRVFTVAVIVAVVVLIRVIILMAMVIVMAVLRSPVAGHERYRAARKLLVAQQSCEKRFHIRPNPENDFRSFQRPAL